MVTQPAVIFLQHPTRSPNLEVGLRGPKIYVCRLRVCSYSLKWTNGDSLLFTVTTVFVSTNQGCRSAFLKKLRLLGFKKSRNLKSPNFSFLKYVFHHVSNLIKMMFK